MKPLAFLFLISIVLMIGCQHDPNEPILPDLTVGPNFLSYDSICFEDHIQPIFNANCNNSGCHDAITSAGNINLTSYSNTLSSVSGSLLLQSILDTGVLRMPLSPLVPLKQNEIELIQLWILQGMNEGIDCQGCDTLDFTFATGVAPIIENNCLGCHNTGDNKLNNYTAIKEMVDNGKLWSVINHDTLYIPMPDNLPQMPYCNIKVIEKWIEDGAPNN